MFLSDFCFIFLRLTTLRVLIFMMLWILLTTKYMLVINYSYAVIAAGCAGCPKIHCGRPGCDTYFCYHCKQYWHPNKTCDAARAERSPNIRSASISYGPDSDIQNSKCTKNPKQWEYSSKTVSVLGLLRKNKCTRTSKNSEFMQSSNTVSVLGILKHWVSQSFNCLRTNDPIPSSQSVSKTLSSVWKELIALTQTCLCPSKYCKNYITSKYSEFVSSDRRTC